MMRLRTILLVLCFLAVLPSSEAKRHREHLQDIIALSAGPGPDISSLAEVFDGVVVPEFYRAESGENGEREKYHVVQQHEFLLQLHPDKALERGALVLTERRLFAFFLSEGQQIPNADEVDRVEAAYLGTGTLNVDHFGETSVDKLGDDMEACARITGCAEDSCKGGRQVWRFCSTEGPGLLSEWEDGVDAAYLKINKIQERLAPAIASAVETARSADSSSSKPPDSFAPFLIGAGKWAEDKAMAELTAIKAAFQMGAIPYRPGKNSRSGASFFFSQNRRYIAKRVRTFEREALWDFVKDGEFAQRINDAESLLNPIYLSYVSEGQPWLIMWTEGIPERAKAALPAKTDKLFEDLKPKPLTSDRVKSMRTLSRIHAATGLSLQSLPNWQQVKAVAEMDGEFLERKALVDYSYLVHGNFFTAPRDKAQQWMDTMTQAATEKPGCTFGCHQPPRRIVDVTPLVLPFGSQGPIKIGNGNYLCCCMNLGVGDSALVRSPCVLKKTRMNTLGLKPWPDSCPTIMHGRRAGESKWENYIKSTELEITRGKCLLGYDVWPKEPPAEGTLERNMPDFLGPEAAFGVVAAPAPAVCGFMCVGILDYLLPMNAWNQFENVMLLPVYGSFKWSDYRSKVGELLECLASAPVSSGSTNPLNDLGAASVTPGVARTVFAAPKEATVSDCSGGDLQNAFSSGWPHMDQQMIDDLVEHNWTVPSGAMDESATCNPARDIYPAQCVVTPDGDEDSWITQLLAADCRGDTIILRLGGEHYALRALGTNDVLKGFFEHTSYIWGGAEDEDWISFQSTRITGEETEEGGFKVTIVCVNSGSYIPVDLAMTDGKNTAVMDHTHKLEITKQAGQKEIQYRQEKADTYEEKRGWFGFPSGQWVSHPEKTGSLKPLPKTSVRLCTPSK